MSRPLVTGVVVVLALTVSIFGSLVRAAQDNNERDYWLQRRDMFYQNTTFQLSKDNLRLLGRKHSDTQSSHLPFWFDYQLFKRVFNKSEPASSEDELARHHIYINTCLRTIKARVLYRMLSAKEDTLITREADMVSELAARAA